MTRLCVTQRSLITRILSSRRERGVGEIEDCRMRVYERAVRQTRLWPDLITQLNFLTGKPPITIPSSRATAPTVRRSFGRDQALRRADHLMVFAGKFVRPALKRGRESGLTCNPSSWCRKARALSRHRLTTQSNLFVAAEARGVFVPIVPTTGSRLVGSAHRAPESKSAA